MFGYSDFEVAGMALAVFMGGLTKGISGVALPIVTLAISLMFVDVKTALALGIIPVMVTNVWQSAGAGNVLAPYRRFWPTMVSFMCTLYFAAQLVNIVEQEVIFAVVGVATLIFILQQLRKPAEHALTPAKEKFYGPLAGVFGGLMGGLTTVWGPPIFMFLFSLRLSKEEWIRSVAALYLFGSIPLTLVFFSNGVLVGERLWLSILSCIPAMAGILVGERFRRHIDEALFRKALLFILFCIGLNMLRRALF